VPKTQAVGLGPSRTLFAAERVWDRGCGVSFFGFAAFITVRPPNGGWSEAGLRVRSAVQTRQRGTKRVHVQGSIGPVMLFAIRMPSGWGILLCILQVVSKEGVSRRSTQTRLRGDLPDEPAPSRGARTTNQQ
jgi:hypothetical protein